MDFKGRDARQPFFFHGFQKWKLKNFSKRIRSVETSKGWFYLKLLEDSKVIVANVGEEKRGRRLAAKFADNFFFLINIFFSTNRMWEGTSNLLLIKGKDEKRSLNWTHFGGLDISLLFVLYILIFFKFFRRSTLESLRILWWLQFFFREKRPSIWLIARNLEFETGRIRGTRNKWISDRD